MNLARHFINLKYSETKYHTGDIPTRKLIGMSIPDIVEVSVLFEKRYPLEVSFVSYDVLKELKGRANEICNRIIPESKGRTMTNGGRFEEYIPLAFESFTWALTGYLSSTNQGLPVFNDESMRRSVSLLENLCEQNSERFFSYIEMWKDGIAEMVRSLYERESLDDLVIYEICDRYYLESTSAKKLIECLKSEGLIS